MGPLATFFHHGILLMFLPRFRLKALFLLPSNQWDRALFEIEAETIEDARLAVLRRLRRGGIECVSRIDSV